MGSLIIMNFNKEWNFVVGETHSEKPNEANLARRELLFYMQILLSKIELMAQGLEELKKMA